MKQPEEFDMGDQWDLVYHRLQIAEEDYETAELLMQGERYRGANNRAYNLIYHTIDAVLSIHGIAFKRHKDTLAYFNKNFVATEIFPRSMGRQIVQAEEIRQQVTMIRFILCQRQGHRNRLKRQSLCWNMQDNILMNREINNIPAD